MPSAPSSPVPEFDPFFGRADRTAWHGYQAKGNLLAARPRYVLERWGGAGIRDVADRLEPSMRAAFEADILPFSWQPLSTLAAIDRAIIEGPMGGNASEMKAFGSIIARYDLRTIYKVLFKLGTPGFIVKRVNVIYQMYIRGGTTTTEVSTARSARVLLSPEASLPFYLCTYGVSGWLSAAIELSGGKGVRVNQVACIHQGAHRCAWQADWT